MSVNFTADQRTASAFFIDKRFEHYKKMYRDVKLALRRLLPTTDTNVPLRPTNTNTHVIANVVNSNSSVGILERIQPPSFNGDRTNKLGFCESFLSVIVNTSLKPVDKFNYLKGSLTDSALDIIRSITISERSFDLAWSELTTQPASYEPNSYRRSTFRHAGHAWTG